NIHFLRVASLPIGVEPHRMNRHRVNRHRMNRHHACRRARIDMAQIAMGAASLACGPAGRSRSGPGTSRGRRGTGRGGRATPRAVGVDIAAKPWAGPPLDVLEARLTAVGGMTGSTVSRPCRQRQRIFRQASSGSRRRETAHGGRVAGPHGLPVLPLDECLRLPPRRAGARNRVRSAGSSPSPKALPSAHTYRYGARTMEYGDELVRRVRELAPVLEERARAAERDRRLSDETIADLAGTGLFQMLVPERFGGGEQGFGAMAAACREIGAGDASAGWLSVIYTLHNWMIALFPEEAQREVWADRPYALVPCTLAPNGTAEAVDGGHRVTGRWSWGSGVMHADHVMVMALVTVDESIEPRLFLLPREDVEVH